MKKYSIIRIPVLPFNMVNAYLICYESGCILLDTGMPGTEQKIMRGLNKFGYDFSDIKLIVVTHAHVDHAGAVGSIKKLTKAPIVAHRNELKYLRGDAEITYCPTGMAGKIFYHTPFPHEKYEKFTPEILISENEVFSLREFGFKAAVLHTSGHTAGSISMEIEDGNAFVGDMLASGILIGGIMRNKQPIQPPFEDDPRAVINSLRQMLQNGNENFFLGHGGPLHSGQVHKHISNLERKIKGNQSG